MLPTVTLEPVQPHDLPAFKRRLQESFTYGARQNFPDFPEIIPPERDIRESLDTPGAEPLQVVCDGEFVGGAIVTGAPQNRYLDFLFVDVSQQDRHLGLATWHALEAYYPDARHWELVTPCFERRNIHFYVNCCGFHITEYFNNRHPDPHYPQEDAGDYPGDDDGLFKFEKVL